ncbi:MAG: HAD family phosphatase [Bacteroidales bacterium]|nr:HAD family phosphatase [Bacteroidales bacterium]MDP3003217.1 HAD family phosphatase [Bacteroidales bacterium]
MIKNIVFDLGNVLISFRPSEFFDKKNYPENIKATILSDIFGSKEWAMLDKGEINTTEAIEAIALKSSLKKEEIAHVFNLRTELMFPLDPNVKLLPELKKRGFRLYFLSNFPMDIFEEVKTGYYFFKYFDGGIISSEAKFSKPDSRIYEILLEKYSLIPEECLYIDDLEINVKAAEAAGMKGLVTFGSLEVYKELEKALILSSG